MKLSEMSSNKAADVILQVMPDIEELMKDEELKEIIASRKVKSDGEDAYSLGKMFMIKIATYLLREKRSTVWNILAAMNDKTAEEISEQNVIALTGQIFEVLGDRQLISFLSSPLRRRGLKYLNY